MDINNRLIKLDQTCDYVPLLSTVTNLVNMIITKIVFRNGLGSSNPYFNYLKSKNDQMGARALIPFAAVILTRHSKDPAIAKTGVVAAEAINRPQSRNKPETNVDNGTLNGSRTNVAESINVNEAETVETESTYEAKVDKFLNKLFEYGCSGNKAEIKREIIESNNLTLRLKNLTVLPKEIGNLTKLTCLYLPHNKLTALPSEIGNLTKLTSLFLENNELTALPKEIGNLTKLTWLHLENNEFTALPSEIGNLTKLTKLYLYNNRVRVLPSEIGNLTNLTDLFLMINELRVLPSEIGKLKNLTELRLYDNQVRVLPGEIGNLTNLRKLNLDNNKLTALPNEIGKLKNLTELSLYNSQVRVLPGEIGNLTNLTILDLKNNKLAALPSEIGNLTNLTELHLDNNELTALPSEIGNLTKLTHLSLDHSSITTLPVAVRNLTQMILLSLEHTPICAIGDEGGWGRQELRAHFRDRVIFSEVNAQIMPAETKMEDVYRDLDERPIHIAREKFKEVKMAEIPEAKIENGEKFLEEFNRTISRLNFDDVNDPGYVSYELLASDFASNDESSNWEKINRDVLPRLLGYLKTLYGLDLAEGEEKGWQMYEDKKESLVKAINYITVKFNEIEDRGQLASLFLMFVNGLLHCPTGQKEGVDTVVLALLENKTERSINLNTAVNQEMAKKKNAFFKVAILTKGAENSQNVHLISIYEQRLREELGLSNILGYQERIGLLGDDPFNNNPANVLKVFYDLITPQRLVDWLLEKVPSVEELKLFEKREELEKRLESGAASPNIAILQNRIKTLEEQKAPQTQIKSLKAMIAQQTQRRVVLSEGEQNEIRHEIKVLRSKIRKVQQFKPIDISMIIDYIIAKEGPENVAKYFTADPTEDRTATLTRDGTLQLLIHLGFLQKK